MVLILSKTSPGFLRVCSKRLLKTLWEKETLLKKSNFSFSQSVFYTFGKPSAILIKLKICRPKFVVKKGLTQCLTLYHTIPSCNKSLEEGVGKKTVGKGANPSNKDFFFPFHTVFSTLSKRKIVILATLDPFTHNDTF